MNIGSLLGLALLMGQSHLTSPKGSDLQLQAPISTWDEALPLGNGEMGALVWGEDHTLRISLDRGDIWDLKHAPEISESDFTWPNLKKLVDKKDAEQIARLFDKPYERQTPTKLPGFRLEMTLTPSATVQRFDLSFDDGVGEVTNSNGRTRFVFERTEPVLVGESTSAVEQFKFVPPTILKELGYPAAELGSKSQDTWIIQATKSNLQYVACVAYRKSKGITTFAVSFVTNTNDIDAVRRARILADSALKHGFDRVAAESRKWWKSYDAVSSVTVPDAAIQKQYDLAMYLYGSGARRGQPPIPLQGLWTADDGGLPPWKGDYHHDLNTQLIYWPYLESGHYDLGLGLMDFLWSQLPVYRRYAQDFFKTKGAAIPGVAALDGTPLAGWGMYSNSPTMGPWLSMVFVDYWRTTRDASFLKTRAYPFCKELGLNLKELLKADNKGHFLLPLSSSPEIHDNLLTAFLKPNSNFDLAVLKAFFNGLREMARALDQKKDLKDWEKISAGLGDLAVDSTGFKISQNEDLTESHRHFSHLMAIHPFSLVSVEGSDADRKVIADSLANIQKLGTSQWCGYSFAWISCMYARCGMAEEARKALSIYASAFVLRNGFHANGDQSGKGYSDFRYRPFTLEGNFAAAQAVHEMLMQSWGGAIRLFPATPWDSASFSNLRAEGGFVVSAQKVSGHVVQASIRATVNSHLVVKTAEKLNWKTPNGPVLTDKLSIDLKARQEVSVGAK